MLNLRSPLKIQRNPLLLCAATDVQVDPTRMSREPHEGRSHIFTGQMASVKRGRGTPARGLPGECGRLSPEARGLWGLVPLLAGHRGHSMKEGARRCEFWGTSSQA